METTKQEVEKIKSMGNDNLTSPEGTNLNSPAIPTRQPIRQNSNVPKDTAPLNFANQSPQV
jgi:hypothetical protein